jgi:hypothetical protein
MTAQLTLAQRTVLLSGVPIEARLGERSDGPPQPSDEAAAVTVTLDEFRSLIGWAQAERLCGLLWRAHQAGELSIVAGASPASVAGVEAALREAVVAALQSSLAAEATGLCAVGALRSAGIEALLFKGLATAHLDYSDPAERTFFDADVLVARRDLPAAVAQLARAGFSRAPSRLRPSWERRFARAVELRNRSGVELDLHAALATGYFGQRLDHDLVRTDRATVDLGGVECHAFGSTARLLISCYAIVLSRGPALRLYGDLARQLLVVGADWRTAARWAGDGDCVVAEALRRVGAVLDIEHEALDWATTVVPSERAQRALDLAVIAEAAGWSADARSTLLALGAKDRARFALGVAELRLRRSRR